VAVEQSHVLVSNSNVWCSGAAVMASSSAGQGQGLFVLSAMSTFFRW
jgi:hypothetical protein